MPKTERATYRLDPETIDQIGDLGRLWGPVVTVSPAVVVAECVKRIHATELGAVARPAPRMKKPRGARVPGA